MTTRSNAPIRLLDANDLGVGTEAAMQGHGSNRPDDPPLADDDPRLLEVKSLLEHYGGVIFSGPPGTSKSWYASKIASALAENDDSRRVFIQFHPSYQYEDFMIGIVPRGDDGGAQFELVEKPMLRMASLAKKDPKRNYVIVIDELSRADPGRVFGEALTYVERSKRGMTFEVPLDSTPREIPHNLVILATMNPLDRGVDEVDAAFERRFARIALDPDRTILESFLDRNGLPEPLRRRLPAFFETANASARYNPLAAIGHTFFIDVYDAPSLQRVWDYQLRFLFEKAYRLDPEGFEEVERNWHSMFRDETDEEDESSAEPPES